jgi:hypothetical protein
MSRSRHPDKDVESAVRYAESCGWKLETFAFQICVSGVDLDAPSYLDGFFEAGCDDALVFVVNGQLRLEFDRQAESYDAAIASARRDIERTGAKVESVERLTD